MTSLQVSRLAWSRPGGDRLFGDVSFRVGDGEHVALVGANGVGKTTLLRLVSGELDGAEGTIAASGRLAVMPQLVGASRDSMTIGELLASFAPATIRTAAERLTEAETRQAGHPRRRHCSDGLRARRHRMGRARRLRRRGALGRRLHQGHR